MTNRGGFLVLEGPLGAAPSALQTRSAHLRGFSSLVRNLGHSPARILEKHGIDPRAILNDDSFVDCPALVEMIGKCSAELDQPLFGLMLARQQSTHILGSLDSLCRAAPDFRTAVEKLCEYLPVAHSPQCELQLVAGRETSEVRLSSRSQFEHLEQMMYGGLHTILSVLREFGGGEFVPAYVSTRYKPSAKILASLETALGCRVQAGQEYDGIVFAAGILDKPLPSANRLTFSLLGEYMLRVRSEQRHSLVDRVEDYIRGALADNCTLRRCATALGMNARSLQSQLGDLGVSFSDLVMRERSQLAQHYILAGDLSLDEIAVRLGYAEQTSFGRAFRRWTGQTPGAFKAAKARETRLH